MARVPAARTSPATAPEGASEAAPQAAPRGRAAVSGALAAITAVSVGELAAGLVPSAPSLVESVGNRVIDSVPAPVKDFAIAVFGTNDKIALIVAIIGVVLLAGALLGLAARRRLGLAVAGFAAFGALAFAATLPDVTGVGTRVAAAVPAVAALVAGVAALRALLRAAATSAASVGAGERTGAPARAETRRAFLKATLALSATAVISASAGRYLLQRGVARAARVAVMLPPPARPLPPPPDAASLEIEGLSRLFTPNDVFYRIDTALTVPQVVPEGWRLAVTGLVDRPLELSYDDLLALPLVERDITLACVSNVVGGELVGTARWTGVLLRPLLERAGVADGAEQVVGRSVDGFTAGFPVEAVFDGREPIVAVGMNGEPLPLEHGFPARLVVPGLFGYVSATKWLSEIELATWDFRAYWVPRGWAREGPILTQSRIDVPGDGATLTPGVHPIAGVAWAPTRGIARVEVSIDDGDWLEARLAAALNDATWRQWVHEWEATPGRHTIRVRATDGTGATQTSERTPPAPDGARGWHTVAVDVR